MTPSLAYHLYADRKAVARAVKVYENQDRAKRLTCKMGSKCAAISVLGQTAFLAADNVDDRGNPGKCPDCRNRDEKGPPTKTLYSKAAPSPNSGQRYCIRGHDTYECGRAASRACNQCKKEAKRRTGGLEPAFLLLHSFRALRRASGMTYEAIYEATGVNPHTLKNYDTERTTCPLDRAKLIAEALGTTVAELTRKED